MTEIINDENLVNETEGAATEPAANTENTQAESKSAGVKAKGWLPTSDVEFLSLANHVAENCPELFFPTSYCNKAQLAEWNAGFAESLDQKNHVKSRKTRTGGTAGELEAEMNSNIERVKDYLKESFGARVAPKHYAAFGIVYDNSTYKLPRNREGLLDSLKQIIKAVNEYGYNDKKYGQAYWTNMQAQYTALVDDTYISSSVVTESTLTKNNHKALIKRALYSVIKIVQAHYPDDYAAQLRIMGFQKEKY